MDEWIKMKDNVWIKENSINDISFINKCIENEWNKYLSKIKLVFDVVAWLKLAKK